MLDAGLLPNLLLLLHSDVQEEHCVLRRTIKVLANICAGKTTQVQHVLETDEVSRMTPDGRFFPLLCDLLVKAPSTHLDIVEEIVWAINNASHGAVHGDFQVLVDDGCFAALEYTISPSVATQDCDGIILRPALEALGNMLRGIRTMEQDAIDAEIVALKQLGKSGPAFQVTFPPGFASVASASHPISPISPIFSLISVRLLMFLSAFQEHLEMLMRQKPTAWASKVPQVFLTRLAERHMSASVCTQARAVLGEFDLTAAQDAGAAA